MLAPPPPLRSRANGSHFGLGWDTAIREPDGDRYSKNGGLPGASTYIEHLPGGIDWVVRFNARVKISKQPTLQKYCIKRLHQAIQHVQRRPERDLSAQFLVQRPIAATAPLHLGD